MDKFKVRETTKPKIIIRKNLKIVKKLNITEKPVTKNKTKIVSNTKNRVLFTIGETSQNVARIEKSYQPINSLQEIPALVEAPLVSTVGNFFTKNIETIDSSANGINISITLYYDTLSPENKVIAKKLGGRIASSGRSGFRPKVAFSMPAVITPTDKITERGEGLANQFYEQTSIAPPSYTLQEFATMIIKKPLAGKQEIMESVQFLPYRYEESNHRIRLRRYRKIPFGKK